MLALLNSIVLVLEIITPDSQLLLNVALNFDTVSWRLELEYRFTFYPVC